MISCVRTSSSVAEACRDPSRLVVVLLVVIEDLGGYDGLVHRRQRTNGEVLPSAELRLDGRVRDHLRGGAADPARPHARPASDRRAQQGRLRVPDPRQPHRSGDRVERRGRARGREHGRPVDRVPQRPRPQPARLPPRPADRGRVRRRPVPLRLRRPADVGRAHRPAHRAFDDRGAAHVPCRERDHDRAPVPGGRRGRSGSAARSWKRDADFLFAQVRFSLDELLEWRSQVEFDGPVYAGIMVVPSVAMARKIGADIQQLAVPDAWLAAIERDPTRRRRARVRPRRSASASRAPSTACT